MNGKVISGNGMYTTYYTNGNGSCDNLTINKYQDQQISNRIFLGKDKAVVETEMRRKKTWRNAPSSVMGAVPIWHSTENNK